jgi:predicted nucleic acid-binding protein
MAVLPTALGHGETTTIPAGPGSSNALLTESAQRLADGDYEGAIRDASTAIQLDPKNPAGYEARGAIYIQEKLWDRAERDYTSASKLSPDVVYKYKLAEIAYSRKTYEDASSRFAALESDPNLGDLAYYEAFLSDLLGGHEAKAFRSLQGREQMPPGPSLYFCHAAWDLYHEQRADAAKCFAEAEKLYDHAINERYVQSLVQTRRFQLQSATFTDRAGTTYNNASIFLESTGLRVSGPRGWITLSLDQLPDDLTAFPEDLREQIDRRRAVLAAAAVPAASTVSFTTHSGQRFDNVHWSLEQRGLSVLTPDGWISLAFSDLPDDLSMFPAGAQETMAARRKTPLSAQGGLETVRFTTKSGTSYSDAKAVLARDGIHVLTPDGWIPVPFRDLPNDDSAFPPDWQAAIRNGRTATSSNANEMQVVTFTTKRGVHYDEVRAALERGGLRLITANGLIAVPYNQLPTDLSSFPAAWRAVLAERVSATVKSDEKQAR